MKRSFLVAVLCGILAIPAYSQAKYTRDSLISAAQSGQLEQVKAIVAANPEFLGGTEWQTPLGAAISNAQVETMAFLLEKGADPNAPSQNSTPLAQALQRYDEKWKPMADLLVAKGAKINATDDEGQTPLLRAISYGGSDRQRERVEWLLEKGADINAVGRSNQSAFDLALSNGSADVAALLVAKIDPKRRDDLGNTPLFGAVRAGKIEAVRALLTRGADVNAQNAAGDAPLHIAARGTAGISGFNAVLLKTLLDAGANANLPNARGDLPYQIALRRDISLERTFNPQTGDFPALPDQNAAPRGLQLAPLLEKTDINKRDGGGFSPLLLSLTARDAESRDLIRERAPKTDSTTALFDAVAGGETPKVAALLTQKPFLVYFRLPDGATPLHIAALWGTLGVAQELAKRGADINARDSEGLTPLHYALRNPTARFARRARNMAQFLIEKGAGVNISTPDGNTALHFAARAGDTELCEFLLEKGAQINARTQNGESPLSLLTSKSADLGLFKLFLKKGANPNARLNNTDQNYYYSGATQTILARAVIARRVDLVRALVENGASVDGDGSGRTPLALAVSGYSNSGDSAAQGEIALYLLEKGADPNARIERQTIFSLAAERGQLDVVKFLLASKKVNLKNTTGRNSPLMAAISNNRTELVKILLEAGADPRETDQYNRTALQVAQGDEVKALLNAKIAELDAADKKAAPEAKPEAPKTPEITVAPVGPVALLRNGNWHIGPVF